MTSDREATDIAPDAEPSAAERRERSRRWLVKAALNAGAATAAVFALPRKGHAPPFTNCNPFQCGPGACNPLSCPPIVRP